VTAPADPVDAVLNRAVRSLEWWAARDGDATSSILGTGAIHRLERLGADRLGHASGLALPSGTAALRAALEAVGVGPGDDVVVPEEDWWAARAAVQSLGATATLVDVHGPELALDPAAAAAACRANTRAVVVTHLFGVPARSAALRSLLPDHVAIIEDVAQALGATSDDGRPVGAVGDVAVTSFGPGKVVDAGEGGLAATSDDVLLHRMVCATQHPAGQVARGVSPPQPGNLEARIHPVAAVMACHGLEGLDDELARRRSRRAAVERIVRELLPGAVLPDGLDRSVGARVPVRLGSIEDGHLLRAHGLDVRAVSSISARELQPTVLVG
jgi:dTDP-4-amino-4,6-dideoxygalactose transaminase